MWIDDEILRQCDKDLCTHIWIPDQNLVVIGNSNQAEQECFVEHCEKDGVEILQRYGGGGAVVLYPGCVILSVGMWVADHFKNDFYFEKLNLAVISALAAKWPQLSEARHQGISDIALKDRKFAGTSLFRSRNYLLYQASLICELNLAPINRYLKKPSREPEYRRGRSHQDFLTGLVNLADTATPANVEKALKANLSRCLQEKLGADRTSPVSNQFVTLLQRANLSKNT